MSKRFAFAAVAASFALTACSSTGASETRAQAPVQPADSSTAEFAADFSGEANEGSDSGAEADPAPAPWAPAPWTGAFNQSAVMLANTFRIEGPVGLLEHVVASSDDAFYERSMETTPDGLLQIIRRVSPDVPEIRVQLDAWTLAAFDRVTILERIDCAPVRVVASGDALWRDSDGRIAKGQRIDCSGEIGIDTPAVPQGALKSVVTQSPEGDGSMQNGDSSDGSPADAPVGVFEGTDDTFEYVGSDPSDPSDPSVDEAGSAEDQ